MNRTLGSQKVYTLAESSTTGDVSQPVETVAAQDPARQEEKRSNNEIGL